jgi:hypothetical protein
MAVVVLDALAAENRLRPTNMLLKVKGNDYGIIKE